MRCSACGNANPAAAKFCEECGAPLPRACPGCGHEVGSRARFCLECGQALASATSAASPIDDPRTYTPTHLAERILAAAIALEGERKQVTVLFADLKGSTELIQGLDPEEAQRLLDGAVKAMMEAVHRYEGTVTQILGDGIMALFGAPLAHEDHAVRACYAALALQEGVHLYTDEARRQSGLELHARVGLNSGEVVVRSIANDLRMDYSAMGPTVHLAARMEQLAREDSICLAPQTLALAEGYVQVRRLGPVPVKGMAKPVEVCELLGATVARSRLQATATRGLTRFVGRQAEVEAVYAALKQAADGRGQIVALVGEPGVGKSRLVWEMTHSPSVDGWRMLESSSVSYGTATTFLPVIGLLRLYFDVQEGDDPREIEEKVANRLRALDRALEPTLPPILALLNVPVEDPAWQVLDPPQRRHHTLEAIKRLLLRESQEGSLLLVFEDLHWIDSETQALLDGLVESLPITRALLLVNYRPEYRHDWSNKTYYTQIRVDALVPEIADELLHVLLGDDPGLEPLKHLLIKRTDGNPFFLEESVRSLTETGLLVGGRGSYRSIGKLDEVRAPATVQAVLASRIDRLPAEDKRLLQTAAVIGKDVPYALLQATSELPAEALAGGLARLQGAEFVHEASLFPEVGYTFKHALTHEVAYGGLLQESRRAGHARIVEAIERLYADRLAEHVEQLAYHSERGEVWEKALSYARQAGAKAMLRSALQQAVTHFEQALAALQHLPETRAKLELAIDIRLDIRSSLYPLGAFAEIVERLREAEAIAISLDDQGRLSRLSCYLASCYFTMGSPTLAIEPAQRALAIAEAIGDFGARALANHYLGLAYHSLGTFRQAVQHLRRNVAALQGDLVNERFGMHGQMSVFSRSPLIWSLAELGEIPDAIALNQESFRIAEAADHPPTTGGAYMGASLLHVRSGDLKSAISDGERGTELCETWGLRAVFPQVAAQLGYAHALAGRPAEGLPVLTRALNEAEAFGGLHNHALWVGWLSEACLLAGRPAQAQAHAERALQLSRERNQRGSEAWALRILGQVVTQREPPDTTQAESCYRQALSLAEELGMRPLQAHCRLGLGRLYRQSGRADDARAQLNSAVELYRSMGMSLWLPEAEAELAQTAG